MTILEIGSEGTFQVLSTSGDTHLGGADFDQRIIDRLVTGFKLKEGIDLTENAMAMQRVKNEAEAAKYQLSQTERVDISVPFIINSHLRESVRSVRSAFYYYLIPSEFYSQPILKNLFSHI